MKTLFSNPNFYLKLVYRILIVGFFTFTGISSTAQTSIWTNPITGTNLSDFNPYTTGDVKNANITVSGIGRGIGISAAKVAAITGFYTATTKTCVGNPKTLTLGTGYIGTIEWLSSPTQTGIYTVIPGETVTTYVYTPQSSGVVYFKVRTTSSPCSVQALTTTGVAVHADTTNCTRQASIESNLFEVKAYPNPSSSEFTIETSAKGAINVRVYDMQGRLVESTDSIQIGSRLAAGTYNIIVNQGANTKAVRVIKK